TWSRSLPALQRTPRRRAWDRRPDIRGALSASGMHVIHFSIGDDQDPANSGAAIISANQLEYFRSQGWTVDCVVARPAEEEHSRDAFTRHCAWANHTVVVDIPQAPWTFRDQLFAFDRAADLPAVRSVLQAPADLFFTNCVLSAPLLQVLSRRCKRVLA